MDWRDGFRAILAGLAVFVFTGVVAGVVFVKSGLLEALGPAVSGVLMAGAAIAACIAALALFNTKGTNPLGLKSAEEQLRELESAGQVVSTDYRDGRVLSLTGQYLYDSEPDPVEARARRFPCDEFTVRRHRDQGDVVDLVEDGEIITEAYDALKARLARAKR